MGVPGRGAHAQRAASDHAVDRRNDAGVGQVEFGAVDQRLRAQHAGLGRLVLRGQHVLLLARGLEGGLVLGRRAWVMSRRLRACS